MTTRPTPADVAKWNCAEDERDWWRAHAKELEHYYTVACQRVAVRMLGVITESNLQWAVDGIKESIERDSLLKRNAHG